MPSLYDAYTNMSSDNWKEGLQKKLPFSYTEMGLNVNPKEINLKPYTAHYILLVNVNDTGVRLEHDGKAWSDWWDIKFEVNNEFEYSGAVKNRRVTFEATKARVDKPDNSITYMIEESHRWDFVHGGVVVHYKPDKSIGWVYIQDELNFDGSLLFNGETKYMYRPNPPELGFWLPPVEPVIEKHVDEIMPRVKRIYFFD